jgi:hypothetical protein
MLPHYQYPHHTCIIAALHLAVSFLFPVKMLTDRKESSHFESPDYETEITQQKEENWRLTRENRGTWGS